MNYTEEDAYDCKSAAKAMCKGQVGKKKNPKCVKSGIRNRSQVYKNCLNFVENYDGNDQEGVENYLKNYGFFEKYPAGGGKKSYRGGRWLYSFKSRKKKRKRTKKKRKRTKKKTKKRRRKRRR